MAKVRRELIVEGECYVIECAVRGDGSSPAYEFLAELSYGVWEPDPDAEDLPDDAQLSDYDKLLAFFELHADEGVPAYNGAVNNLDNGIWEFKIGRKRLSYFDTPGDGTYKPKLRIRDRGQSARPQEDFWWYPDFDEFIRLGHAFPKRTQQTETQHLVACELVRDEDLQHDREV